MKRRRFLTATAGAAAALPFLSSRRAKANIDELVPDAADVPILDLLPGFRYSIVEASLDPANPTDPAGRGVMSDGYLVPGAPDGMACFQGPDETWILMRNHELVSAQAITDAFGALVPNAGDLVTPFTDDQGAPPESFDPGNDDRIGGVSRVVVRRNGRDIERVSSNLVLVGSWQNCAGGPTPWGSWLSCEETTDDPEHGFVFDCPIDASSVRDARSLRTTVLGRFSHEAAAVDPANNVIYLTEDRGDSVFYRYVPANPSEPLGDGQLQAMRIVGEPSVDTGEWGPDQIGVPRSVEWFDLEGADSPADDLRARAAADGAAIISRGEGIAISEDGASIFVVSTNGGPNDSGQIFRLDLGDTQEFQLVTVAEDDDVLESPDNIVVAPWGDVYIAEDGGDDQFIRVLKPTGEIYTLARNAAAPLNVLAGISEFAGVCFSPDGSTLFCNIQLNGLTLAIQGPFEDIGRSGGGGGGCSVGRR